MISHVFLKLVYYSSLWFRNLFSREFFTALKHHCQGHVLDVGGGSFYKVFKKTVRHYASYTNLEYDGGLLVNVYQAQLEHHAQKDHRTVYGDGTRMPFRDHCFDTVISSQVLEHIVDPAVMIDEIYRVLKPGGKGIFLISQTTPVHALPFHYGTLSLFGAREAFGKTDFRIIDEKLIGGLWRTILFRHIFFFLQLFRLPGFSSAEFKRNALYYFLVPLMALYVLISLPVLLLFNVADHKEDANNLVFVVEK